MAESTFDELPAMKTEYSERMSSLDDDIVFEKVNCY